MQLNYIFISRIDYNHYHHKIQRKHQIKNERDKY